MREHAQYFRFFRRERGSRGLAGGERRIRTPETLQDSRCGIQPEFGAQFGPNKSIRAEENSARLGFGSCSDLIRFPSFAMLTRGIWCRLISDESLEVGTSSHA